MTSVIFATPDFGAGACAAMVVFLLGAMVVAAAVLSVWLFFRTIKSVKRKRILALSLVGVSVPACFFVYLYEFKPYNDFKEILSGQSSVRIDRIEISGQGRHVTLEDPATISYLNERLRLAALQSDGGITYSATVYLSTGNSVYCAIYVPTEKSVLTIYFPGDNLVGEGSYYLVSLPEPVPPVLSHVLVELGK
jgi:hypothetical protein